MVKRSTYAICAGACTLGVVLAPITAPGVLSIVGFSAAGPVAGSLAAAIQAGIGNVAAGSLFAGAQSVAMGGALPAIGSVIAGGISTAAAVVANEVRTRGGR